MTYYKLLSYADSTVVGVEAVEKPAYVRWQEKHRMLVRCDREDAEGIISSEDNDTIYQIEGKRINGVEQKNLLIAVFISADEYAAALDEEEIMLQDEADPAIGGEEKSMTVREMREKIAEMEEALNIIMGVVE